MYFSKAFQNISYYQIRRRVGEKQIFGHLSRKFFLLKLKSFSGKFLRNWWTFSSRNTILFLSAVSSAVTITKTSVDMYCSESYRLDLEKSNQKSQMNQINQIESCKKIFQNPGRTQHQMTSSTTQRHRETVSLRWKINRIISDPWDFQGKGLCASLATILKISPAFFLSLVHR